MFLNKLINNENIKFYRVDFERGWIMIVYKKKTYLQHFYDTSKNKIL